MSATFAPSTWPHRQPRAQRTLGRSFGGPRDHGGAGGMHWLLKPNCSITPRQLGAAYLSLCAVSALIAGVFYVQGAPFVAAFAGLELLALGAALLAFSRHATDFESITLQGRVLRVLRQVGRRVDRHEWPLAWLTVEPALAQGSLVQLRGRGQQLQVGRHLRHHERSQLAAELRQAQRHALATAQDDSN